MKNVLLSVIALLLLAGCDAVSEKVAGAQAAKPATAHNCVTTGPNSPIVTGANSVVVIDGQAHEAGQVADCASAASISTHGAGSPIVTGAGAQVIITTDR